MLGLTPSPVATSTSDNQVCPQYQPAFSSQSWANLGSPALGQKWLHESSARECALGVQLWETQTSPGWPRFLICQETILTSGSASEGLVSVGREAKWTGRCWKSHPCGGLLSINVLLTCDYGMRSRWATIRHPHSRSPTLEAGPVPSKGPKTGPSSTEPDPCLADVSAFASSAQLNLQTWREGLSQKQTVWSQGNGVHAKSPLCFNE